MYHHLNSLKRNFLTSLLSSFFYYLFLPCVVYSCGIQNRTNVETITSNFVACPIPDNINTKMQLEPDKHGNTPLNLALEKGDKNVPIKRINDCLENKSVGKRFKSSTSPNINCNTHTEERPYPCGICSESFHTHIDLEKHEKACIKGRPLLIAIYRTRKSKTFYFCRLCSARFYARFHCEIYYRIHTNEKPFECPICNRAFNTTCSLKRHEKSPYRNACKLYLRRQLKIKNRSL